MSFVTDNLGHRAKDPGSQEHDPREGWLHPGRIPQTPAPLDHDLSRNGR